MQKNHSIQKRFKFLWSGVLLLVLAAPLLAEPPELKLPALDSVQSLDGDPEQAGESPWFYTTGSVDPRALSERLSRLGPAGLVDWQPIKVPAAIRRESAEEIWVAKTFIAPDYERSLVLRLGVIEDRDRTYLNGVLIGSTGDWNATEAQAYDKIRIYNLPENLVRRGGRNVLLVKVRRFFPKTIGILSDTVALGPGELIYRDFYITQFTQAILLTIYFTAGAYFLFLFLRRLKDRENLLFGMFCMSLVAYQFFRTQLKYDLGLDFYLMKRIEYVVLFYMPPLFYFFLREYFKFEASKLLRIFDSLMAAVMIVPAIGIGIVLFNDDARAWNDYNYNWIQKFHYLPITAGMLVILITKVIRKDRDALYILAGMLGTFAALVVDILVTRHILNIPRIMPFAFMFCILNLVTVLANRFVRLHGQVEDLNTNLEKKVDQRTEQLRNRMSEIQALKEQQDGDYWLTSLLVNPLSGLFSRTENVNIDLLERQKKKFHFRKYDSEIGGDINAVHTINLRGRNYTAFINGDAMGKSIQGAGGALVLGVVFKSVIARTEQVPRVRNQFPEQWLKDCFVEFQNVFVSFDGSMLMSAVMGLVDDETGLVYFINAEHPWVVLYRDGRAEFIESELFLRKLGTTGMDGPMQVKTFQMQTEDVLLLGSDGRDDILLEERDGERIINEDENEFLRHVENGSGRLDAIEKEILKRGKLTDDLSLLRIGYREDAPLQTQTVSDDFRGFVQGGREAFQTGDLTLAASRYELALRIQPDQKEAMQELGKIYFKAKEYGKAADLLERYTSLYPGDVEFLYLVSVSSKQFKSLKRAADFGERCRLRNPDNVKNLVNLADVYRLLKDRERAEMLLELALKLDPDYKNAHRLQEALRKAG